jgi:hypothetical protein
VKVVILYRSNSEHEQVVREFEHEYTHRTGRQLVLMDLNTKEGAELASLYDIVRYPAVLATTASGAMLQLWQDESLPLINEVMYYDQSG